MKGYENYDELMQWILTVSCQLAEITSEENLFPLVGMQQIHEWTSYFTGKVIRSAWLYIIWLCQLISNANQCTEIELKYRTKIGKPFFKIPNCTVKSQIYSQLRSADFKPIYLTTDVYLCATSVWFRHLNPTATLNIPAWITSFWSKISPEVM